MGEDDLSTPGGLLVPASALVWNFARSSGAGGQHVNKTSSKVTLAVETSDVVAQPAVMERLQAGLPARVRVTSEATRSQWRNRQRCLEHLGEILDAAAKPPAAKRRASRPTRGSVERRLDTKRRDSAKKQSRRGTDW